MAEKYPRDMIGYGRNPPDAKWPGGANVAVQFVVNYEEGGENNILHGDAASEAFLSEIVGAAPWPGMRHANMESIYEYGSRVGFWRLWRMFTERKVPTTVYAVATAIALTGSSLSIVPILLFAQIRGDVLGNPHLGYAIAFGMIVITATANTLYIWLRARSERWLK